jgi:hypothetical protein
MLLAASIVSLTFAKDLAQTLAFAGAFVFFVYKVINGYLIVNTSIGLDVARGPSGQDPKSDILVLTITLERGQLGSLTLHDVQARVTWPEKGEAILHFPEILRLSYTAQANPKRKTAILDRQSTNSPLLRLAPGEKTSFGAWLEVPAHLPCSVSAVALGRLMGGWKIGQWRASRATLPRAPVAKD